MRKIILSIIVFTCLTKDNVTAQYWSPLGTGIGSASYHSVQSFATYNGVLYAGGYFTTAGGISVNNIAKWNDTSWATVGSIEAYYVKALTTYNGELYAGGSFVLDNYETPMARWNGTSWATVGNIEAYDVRAFVTYNGDLYAAGWFNINTYEIPIAKWNGNNWTSVGPEDSLYSINIECLTVYNNELYAAGAYYQIGGGGVAEFYKVIKWNGSAWSTVVTIPASYTLDGALGDIYSMIVYNNELYISGSFTSIDTLPTHHIAKWNGTNWSAVGTGINPEAYPICCFGDGSEYSYVKSLAVFDGALYAGGRFDSSGAIATRNIAKWDGTYWSSLGQGVAGPVYALLARDSSLYVGGGFNSVNGNSIPANKVAEWRNSCATYLPQPDSINGNNFVCENSSHTYSINTVPGATSYTWSLPSGWTGSSATNTISVIVGSTGGSISVTANNNCGSSIARSITVGVTSVPQPPGPIIGNDVVCENSTITYSVNSVTGATNYSWILPPGWTGSSTSNIITTITGINSGLISVIASNHCGATTPQTILVTTETVPAAPALINGNDTVCEGSTQTYFTDPVRGATGYAWDLTFGTAFGFDSTAITVTALHSGYPDDFITVSAYNNCGNSDMVSLPVKVNLLPYQPNKIFGSNLICRSSNQTYFIDPVPGATSYTWIIPTGWIGNSNTSSINLNVGNETGNISVRANNSCGSGAFLSLPILFDTIPAKPGTINGNAYVAAGEKHGYSVDVTSRPPGYNWSLSGGGNLTAGQSPHKIEIDWQTPGTYVLSVNAVNSCGVSAEQKMNIIVSGAEEKDPYGLQLVPNPSAGIFFLKAKRLQDKWVSIKVINISGQLVLSSEKRSGTNDYSQLIDLDKLAPGIYVVKIIIDDKVYTKKVLITN